MGRPTQSGLAHTPVDSRLFCMTNADPVGRGARAAEERGRRGEELKNGFEGFAISFLAQSAWSHDHIQLTHLATPLLDLYAWH